MLDNIPNVPPIIWVPVLTFVVTVAFFTWLYFRITRKARAWVAHREQAVSSIQSLQSALSQTEAALHYQRTEAEHFKKMARRGHKKQKAPKRPSYKDNRPKTVVLSGGQPVPNPSI